MQIIFHLVLIFNHIANELFLNIKDIFYIQKITYSNFLILTYNKAHNYNLDSNFYNNKAENIKVSLLSLYYNILYSSVFDLFFWNKDDVSCQLFLTLLINISSTYKK